MKGTPFMLKQKLSKEAALNKAARDLAAANSPARKAKRAENQRLRRAALRKGVNLTGKDYDHRTASFKSVKYNRGNNGNGTKREG
tara:strand:+ start:102 stop:356 length:255 start_codon:yes stop_codon:yes gene_type:complete